MTSPDAAAPVSSPAPATDPATGAPDDRRPRYRAWYWLGIVLQVFVWTLIWLGIAIAIGVGGKLTEFRYVGF